MRLKLKTSEQLIMVFRMHWIIFFLPALILMGVISLIILSRNANLHGFEDLAAIIKLPAMIMSVGYFVFIYLERITNIWILTNMRVVDEWGIITHNSKESRLDKIHNVSVEQSIIGRILGYGDVKVQTAAEQGSTIYPNIDNPKIVQASIFEWQDKHRQSELNLNAGTASPPEIREQEIREPENQTQNRQCSFCAETIKAAAVICRFCNREQEVAAERTTDLTDPERTTTTNNTLRGGVSNWGR